MFFKRSRSSIFVKQLEPTPQQKSRRRFWLSVGEIIIFLVVLNLLGLVTFPKYKEVRKKSTLASNLQNMNLLLSSLIHYQIDYPNNRFLPPENYLEEPGIVLSPLKEPEPQHLQFLADRYDLLDRVPVDPYMTGVYADDSPYTSLPLRWTRTRNRWEEAPLPFEHHGWGILSIGPSYEIPPQYDITVLRKVPYYSFPIEKNLYDPSNGIYSIGFLYTDTYGNGNMALKDVDISEQFDYSEGNKSR